MRNLHKAMTVVLMVALITLMASPAFARSISFKDAGTALWVFVVIGAIIVLLQLIPAAILFFSFIGTATAIVFKGEKKAESTSSKPSARTPGSSRSRNPATVMRIFRAPQTQKWARGPLPDTTLPNLKVPDF